MSELGQELNTRNNSETVIRSKPSTSRLWMILILGALSAFGPLSLDMYLPSLPELARSMHTTTSLTQLSLTSCLIGLAVGQLLAGPLSDIRGRRLPLIIGMVVYGVASLLCAFSTSIEMLIALRFIQGIAGSAGIVISRAIVRDMYSGSELTKFFSMLMLVNGAAPILSPIIGGQLLKFTSWRGVFIVLTFIGVAMLLAVLFGLPETLSREKRSKGGISNTLSTFGTLFRDPGFVGLALCQGFVSAAMFAYISGSPFVLQDIFGVSPQSFGLIFAANGIGIIIAGQITGRLAGRVSERTLFLSGITLATIGGFVLLLTIVSGAGLGFILPPLFIVVSCVGIVGTAGSSLALQNYGHAAGSASALLGLLSYILGALVMPLVGIMGNGTAVPMGIVIAGADVGAVLCYLLLVRRPERKAAASSAG
ncbi:MFS transporter, DHA1 family, bicyclomycin/chloramphenicol resistance protein [Paenibacillus uliginis N3/975]|uniref:Bcr/CflA family efflux transporter n=2 Tax=Paenibacillus TaxID=44249 RepID=A0A1X7HQP2_9BACL|nr:Bcr/CflA family multidrug efflux MFS transporter [Paenibacillus uliginis]SMF90040.1 MFS transporter, DHA1 family, bicyclomycin/chloramphenicol resistance protein [Paenibacillus uliginis N3/975]